ncbi:hypothetical protein B9G54_02190 [Alloscardovia macacae]|uniref:Glycosyltransferase n=1 Tax=Alloscardovia macacae TaxID=1160091 RepID=A0A1Y2T1T8_9BIFI|nr:hypothetical protein [Alloscardovia macacae]OTA27074.1 hypothetical protein B9G54_02190 [Alloscardovia macacae]OTA29734.1 hypothetical protein B9T39_02565 [Alloscardovia macacae]
MKRLHHSTEVIRAADTRETVSVARAVLQAVQSVETSRPVLDARTAHLSASERSIDPTLAAVVTVEKDTRYLAQTLTAVLRQTVLPGSVILVQCMGADALHQDAQSEQLMLTTALESAPTAMHVVTLESPHSWAGAVTAGINEAAERGMISNSVEFLWFLHDDSRPLQDNYVDLLNEVRHNNSTASFISSKQLSWDGEVLQNVGYFARSGHRLTTLVVDGEPDQDQYDSHQDVYAASLTGAFVRRADWMRLGGFTSATQPHTGQRRTRGTRGTHGAHAVAGTYGVSSDFGRRVSRSGGRVIVEPRARIGHRRARLEGVRTTRGTVHPVQHEDLRTFKNTALAQKAARDTFYYSDMSMLRWIYIWPLSILLSLVRAVSGFIHKQPYEALCELLLPWYMLTHLGAALTQRRMLASVQKTTVSQLSQSGQVVATADQLRVLRDHEADLTSQQSRSIMSPMVRKHVRNLARRRYTWLAGAALVTFVVNVAVHFTALRGIVAGSHLASSTLVSTASTTRELFEAATTVYSFGDISGTPLPSSPFLLLYALASLFTFGHAYATSALILVVSVPAALMSMWALAGVFTRSNLARITLAMTWVASGYGTGVFLNGNLPLMVVYAVLPAAVAFTAKAVGVYQTEDPIESEPSVQAAAWSALCYGIVCACEPAYILLLVVVGIVSVLVWRRHVIMLVSLLLPSVLVLLPTFVSVVREPQTFGQLFADVTTGVSGLGTVRGSDPLRSLLGVFLPANTSLISLGMPAGVASAVVLVACVAGAALLVLSVMALAVPSALGTSRTLWLTLACAAFLAAFAPSVAVALGDSGVLYASVLPAGLVMLLCILTCAAILSGPARAQFIPILAKDKRQFAGHLEGVSEKESSKGRILFGISRGLIVALCVLMVGVWTVGSVANTRSSQENALVSSSATLPIVAREYVQAEPGRRVVVVQMQADQHLSYSILPSAHGDIIFSSAALDASRVVHTQFSTAEMNVGQAIASLAESNDDDAITALSDAGIGGVYVLYTSQTQDSAFSSFVANASASNNTQTVVNNERGAYIRISVKATSEQGVSLQGFDAAVHSVWRVVWISAMLACAVIYLALALPRMFIRGDK